MAASNEKFYLSHWNKIVDEYNIYHHFIGKKPIDDRCPALTNYSSWLPWQIRNNLNLRFII